jgi:hypothetical protein
VGVDPALDAPPGPPVESVPFDGGAGDPVEPLPMPVPKVTEARVLDGQYVVVYVKVWVVEPILEIVVMVAVVLLETPVPDSEDVVELNGSVVVVYWEAEDVVELNDSVVVVYWEAEDAELVDVLEADDDDEEIGVQSGRVKVPLKLPDAPYTTQLEIC